MMYYYMMASGEYSDYHINAIVASETEITPADWQVYANRIAEWLTNEPTMKHEYFIDGHQWRQVLTAVGLSPIEYTEYEMDAREGFDDDGWKVWATPRDYR